MRIFALFLIAFSLLACNENKTPSVESSRDSDTLVIVASRLFESRTYENYIEPLAAPDVIPWVNASELSQVDLKDALRDAHGVILTGGADIHPSRYQQAADTQICGAIDVERDALESFLLDEVDRTGLPCSGICRGMQFMNVHGGGSLYAHLPAALGHDGHRGGIAEHHVDTTHAVFASRHWSKSNWRSGDSSDVISHHHQGIDRLSAQLGAWAFAPDGLIEGVMRLDTLRYPCYIGVQWHPERSLLNQPLVENVGSFFVQHVRLHDE